MGIKYAVDEQFFDEWSPEMAYVLGYFFADGSLEDASYIRGKYVRVTSVDQEIILKIKTLLQSQHHIVERAPDSSRRKTLYLLRIGSHRLYGALINLGLSPRKSLTIRLPKIPKRFLSHFMRGYFDGDGGIYIEKGKGKNRSPIRKRLLVVFTSGSEYFLKDLAAMLHQAFKMKQAKVYRSRRSYQLRYGTGDSLKLFRFLYGSGGQKSRLERKLKVFLEYLKIRKRRFRAWYPSG